MSSALAVGLHPSDQVERDLQLLTEKSVQAVRIIFNLYIIYLFMLIVVLLVGIASSIPPVSSF